MAQILNVFALPTLAAPDDFIEGTVVVIDVLRASTTIIHAFEAGASEVIPCLEVEEARKTAAVLPKGQAVLGGERGGLKIDGFDLGNSPEDYTPEAVAGKTVVFTTTNGTRAMQRCTKAGRVLIGAFANAEALCRKLAGMEIVHLVCAGTRDQMTNEDILLAGLIVQRLQQRGDMQYTLNAQAITARETWQAAFALPHALGAEPLEPERLAVQLESTIGGQDLIKIGLKRDILVAAHLDQFQYVPELDVESFRIS
ncbi:MAG: 2-phosphosulfolactate phosphatase [Planctomycetota bacterium]|nr:2-phosphosulfolactate phosphatase [Planctomycetota bacterium]